MEVHFTPELEKKLNDLATRSGRPAEDLVQDAVASFIDERAATRAMLGSRYSEIKTGRVNLIPGDEAFARLRERMDGRRHNQA